MATHFNNNEEMHILSSENRINTDYPLIIIELVKNQNANSIFLKTRHISDSLHKINEMYLKLKTYTNNPLLVVNAFLSELNDNEELKKSIANYYNNIKIGDQVF